MSVEIAVNPVTTLGEGPFWDAETGRVVFVDIIGRRGLIFTPSTGGLQTISFPGPVPVVIPRVKGGYLAALAKELVVVDEAGSRTPFAVADSHPLTRNNETRTDAKGRLWVGTMQNNIGPNDEDLPVTQNLGTLSRVDPDGTVTTFLHGIGISNTLVWSPDHTKLYFANSLAQTIYVHDFDLEQGTVGPGQVFFHSEDGYPDGSAIDAEGYIWNARWDGACLLRIAPDGTLDRKIALPATRPTSCVFGGPDLTTLYITTARVGLEQPTEFDGALLKLETGIKGAACTRFAG